MISPRSFFYIVPVGLIVLLVLDLALRPALVDDLSEHHIFPDSPYSQVMVPDQYGAVRPNLKMKINHSDTAFTVETNKYGMRMDNVPVEKVPNTVRVAVMGDSIAFGWGLALEDIFPKKIETLLNHDSKMKFEVLNFAVPGYTSFHAVKQYESLVHNFQPDVLILAFGLYDSYENRLPEQDIYALLEDQGMVSGKKGLLGLLNTYSSVGSWMVRRKNEKVRQVIAARIQEQTQKNEWKQNVSSESFKTCLSAIIDHHQKQGGKTILVNDNLLHFELVQAIHQLAAQYNVPLLDIRSVFDGVSGYEARKKQTAFDLAKSGIDYFNNGSQTHYLFRVYSNQTRAISNGLFITGNLPELGNNVPNTVRMYDDGTHGDERAGDLVWSLQVSMPKPVQVQFAFTVNGVKGLWGDPQDGFENTPKNKHFMFQFIPPATESFVQWCSPVYEIQHIPFEHLLLEPSSPFPNDKGHTAIARRLVKLVRDSINGPSREISQR